MLGNPYSGFLCSKWDVRSLNGEGLREDYTTWLSQNHQLLEQCLIRPRNSLRTFWKLFSNTWASQLNFTSTLSLSPPIISTANPSSLLELHFTYAGLWNLPSPTPAPHTQTLIPIWNSEKIFYSLFTGETRPSKSNAMPKIHRLNHNKFTVQSRSELRISVTKCFFVLVIYLLLPLATNLRKHILIHFSHASCGLLGHSTISLKMI